MKLKFLSLLLVIFNIFSCVTYAEDELSLNTKSESGDAKILFDEQSGVSYNDVSSSSGEADELINVYKQKDNESKSNVEESETIKTLKNIKEQIIENVDDIIENEQNRVKIKIYTTNIVGENINKTLKFHYVNFINEFFDRCVSVVDETPNEVTYAGARLQSCWVDHRCRPNKNGVWEEKNIEVYVYEKCVQINNLYGYDFENTVFPVTDGSKVVDYLNDIKISGLPGFQLQNNSDLVIAVKDIDKKIDKIDFEFVVPESFKGIFTENIANIGESVSVILEHYTEGNSRDYYLLTLNGTINSVTIWTTLSNTMLGGTGYWPSSNTPIEFPSTNRVKNNTLVYDYENSYVPYILAQMVFSDNELKSVKIACQIPYISITKKTLNKSPLIILEVQSGTMPLIEETMKNAAIGEKAVYTVYQDDDYSLSESFKEVDKESEIERLKEEALKYGNVESQDPEKWTTRMKGGGVGGKFYDYKINFLAQIPLDNSKSCPEWYKSLGDNVVAVIMGYTMNLKNVVSIDETMICLKGDKGSVWFENTGTLDNKTDLSNKTKAVAYDSLISFDGSIKVKNTIEHETISAIMEFTNDSREDLKSITIDLGTVKISADIDEFKYIGGGEIVYDKIW